MGKGGRGKEKKAAGAVQDDDALLDMAIAEKKATAEKLANDQLEAKRALVAKEVEVARKDMAGEPLSREEIVAKLDTIPAFCIVDAKKQFVPLTMQNKAGSTDDVVVVWTEPLEAKDALAQAIHQRPSAQLAMGTIGLGKAFALSEGWAEAAGATRFRLQAHSKVSEELRPLLTRQLEQQGMATADVFPIFMCEELSTEKLMPVFLSRAEMASTWNTAMAQAGVARPPPAKLTAMDLRILVRSMQSGGMDWSVLTFVGTDRAWEVVQEGQRQEEERPPPLE